MADMRLEQSVHQSPNTTLIMPSTPLQLSGFLSGDTIQVKGDTGNLKFSVQFSIQEKQDNHSLINSLGANACDQENHSCENSSFSSYMTPNAVQEVDDHQSACYTEPVLSLNHENGRFPEEGDKETETRKSIREAIVTRLRSGVISPVKYFPRILSIRRSLSSRPYRKEKLPRNKNGAGKINVFEKVLRRHSSPIGPCTSYAFFVMATWGVVKSSSFGETSKQVGRMWCQLPQQEKRFYKEMAMKDNARYKRQCMQLMEKPLRVLKKGSRCG